MAVLNVTRTTPAVLRDAGARNGRLDVQNVPALVAEEWQKFRCEFLNISAGEQACPSIGLISAPPICDSKAVPLLECLFEVCAFACSIMNTWMTVCPTPGRGLVDDPLAAAAINDLRVLENIAYSDRLLWAWLLGRFPEAAIPIAQSALREAKRKWLPAALGQSLSQDELASIGLQWADERVPHIHALIEAAPFDWGPEADPMGVRETVKRAAQPISAASDLPASVAALSTTLHKLIGELYRCAGAQYIPVRLYSDRIHTGDIAAFISATKAAYAFKQSDLLVDRQVATAHGVVVRVTQPITRRRDPATGQTRWEGSLYYLQALKK